MPSPPTRTIYCLLAQYRAKNLMASFKHSGLAETLEIYCVTPEIPPDPVHGLWYIPFYTSALDPESAIDVTAFYTLETYPKLLPDFFHISPAPESCLRDFPRKQRKHMLSNTCIKEAWEGVIQDGSHPTDLSKIIDLVFENTGHPWENFPAAPYPKKSYTRPN